MRQSQTAPNRAEQRGKLRFSIRIFFEIFLAVLAPAGAFSGLAKEARQAPPESFSSPLPTKRQFSAKIKKYLFFAARIRIRRASHLLRYAIASTQPPLLRTSSLLLRAASPAPRPLRPAVHRTDRHIRIGPPCVHAISLTCRHSALRSFARARVDLYIYRKSIGPFTRGFYGQSAGRKMSATWNRLPSHPIESCGNRPESRGATHRPVIFRSKPRFMGSARPQKQV